MDGLLKIFTIDKLRDLKRHCKTAEISRHDFANIILWSKGQGPYIHTAQHREFVPDHLHLSETDLRAIAENGIGRFKPAAKKAANKTFAIFDERRLLSGHLFQSLHHWHLFYFDNHDQNQYANHWRGGPHIHLINHLMPNRTAESVWSEFCDGNPMMSGALHIRMSR